MNAELGRVWLELGERVCERSAGVGLSATGAVGDAAIGGGEVRGVDGSCSGLCDGGVGWMLIAGWASSRWRMCGLRWSGR